MKYVATLAFVAVAVVAGSYVWAEHHEQEHGDQAAWFDAQTCDVCKPMMEDPSLMFSMKWETHKINNGMLMVTVVPDELHKKFDEISEKMHAKGKQLEEGKLKDAHLCGFCQSYGKLLAAGAKEETVKTGFGSISLLTAEKPETVKMIHKHAERTQEEAKKMAEMMKHAAVE